MTDDVTWLDRHPRIDDLVLRGDLAKRRVQQAVDYRRARRVWQPGTFYLDHGSHPCVLIRLYDQDTLEGVSLVDGHIKSGCSIYACGPEKVTRAEALRIAAELQTEATKE